MSDDLRLQPRPLGKTGLMVSPLGLAGMSIRGANPPGPALVPEDVERAFHDHGVTTFFVTRHMKALAEGVRRLVAAGHRDRLTIISCANLPLGFTIPGAFEKNARALGTDVIDVWLIGWVQYHWYVTGETWTAMRRLKEQGRVRALGFSCHDRALAVSVAREVEADVLMIRYNAAHRGAEKQIFAELGEARPGIISYTATRWGMLLQGQEGFDRPMTPAECYRFVLGHPAVDVALCGARSGDEIRADVAGVLAGPLDEARLEEIRRFGDAVHARAKGGLRWMFRQG